MRLRTIFQAQTQGMSQKKMSGEKKKKINLNRDEF